MGMGIDNPDIRIVVQWHQPDSLSALWQRGSRVAQRGDICSKLLWLIEPWCIGPRKKDITLPNRATHSSQLSQYTTSASLVDLPPHSPGKVTKKLQEESIRHSNMPAGFWSIFNDYSCIQMRMLHNLGEDMSIYQGPITHCCCVCDRESFEIPVIRPWAVRVTQSTKWIMIEVEHALVAWREGRILPEFA